MLRASLIFTFGLTISACTAEMTETQTGVTPGGAVSEFLRANAAPFQDLSTARIRPEDGCYWYLHVGPVETTLLPVRTRDGRTICTTPAPTEA